MEQNQELHDRFVRAAMELDEFSYSSLSVWPLYYMKMFGKAPDMVWVTEMLHVDEQYDMCRANGYKWKQKLYDENAPKVYGIGTVVKIIDECPLPKYTLMHAGSRIVFMEDIIIIESINAILYHDTIPEEVKACAVFLDKEENKYSYVMRDSDGFSLYEMSAKSAGEGLLLDHYNDDLPVDKVDEFIESNEPGIAIFNGEPGTGKTYYIRSLISRHPSVRFLYMDPSVFNYITDVSFIKMLLDNQGAVVIMEDCEEMLKDRTSGNQRLSALLNMSDGIMGDGLKMKFICTFNAPLNKIDKAVMRKGRMKLMYSFGKLSAEKATALSAKLGIGEVYKAPTELCNVYNTESNVVSEGSVGRKVGFKNDK